MRLAQGVISQKQKRMSRLSKSAGTFGTNGTTMPELGCGCPISSFAIRDKWDKIIHEFRTLK